LEVKNGPLSFAVMAPLPWPAPVTSERIRQADPLISQIGAVSLKVTGLAPGNYKFSVDGSSGVDYSAAQLEAGVSLTAVSAQAQIDSTDLAKSVRDKEDIEYMRWRDIQVRFAKLNTTAQTAQSVDELAREAFAVARRKAQPRRYDITITPEADIKGINK
jgi:hypothetical protein